MPDNGHEAFWRGTFGDDYTDRNLGYAHANIAFFAKALQRAPGVKSIFEVGTNRGLNLSALSVIQPQAERSGIELNDKAASIARESHPRVVTGSIHDLDVGEARYDLVFTKGVLIHIDPDKLGGVFDKISRLSSNYVLLAEYFNPTPVQIDYRGHDNRLYKRDFAKDFMDTSGFALVDYGFVWRHDPVFPDDDITWFLMQRR